MAKMRIGDLFELEKGLLQSSKCTEGKFDFITASKEWKTHNEYSHNTEALVFAAMASGSLGRTHYVNGKFISSDLCYIMTPKDSNTYPIDLKFYHFVFNSLKDEIVKNTKSGTSKEAINQTNLKNYVIPYFDIEQQHLWIKKLVSTREIKKELVSEIVNQQKLLKKFRQSILQDAIEGKLTVSWRKQNTKIESASVLLEKIKTEKEQLVKEKKIKKLKPLPLISEDEMAFDIPNSWEWCKLGDIVKSYQNGISKRNGTGDSVIVLRLADIKDYKVDLSDTRTIDLTLKEQEKYVLAEDDILITRVNGSVDIVGNFNRIGKQNVFLAYCDHFIRLNFINKYISSKFIEKLEKTNLIRNVIKKEFKTTSGQKTINQGHISNLAIPLPPLEEQQEIVNRIENLFKVCDELETKINSSKINSETLMLAVLKEAFEQ